MKFRTYVEMTSFTLVAAAIAACSAGDSEELIQADSGLGSGYSDCRQAGEACASGFSCQESIYGNGECVADSSSGGGSNGGGGAGGSEQTGGNGSGGSDIEFVGAELRVEVTDSGFIGTGGVDGLAFPGIIAHLYGRDLEGQTLNFACFDVTNIGDSVGEFEILTRVQNFSEWGRASGVLQPGEVQNFCLNPVFDYAAIDSLRLKTRTVWEWDIRRVGSDDVHTETSVDFLPSNQMPWNELFPAAVAVLVTPQGRWVQDFQDDVNRYAWTGGFGVGGYEYAQYRSIYFDQEIADGEARELDLFYLKNGESLSAGVESIAGRSNISLTITNQDGQPIADWQELREGESIEATAPSEGFYFLLAGLSSDQFLNAQSLTVTRTLSRADKAWDYLQAIFYALRDYGVIYANINGFDAAQTIRRPSDVGRGMGANCIEGALTFASLAELFGVRPAILGSLANGHAFVGIFDEDGMLWSLETTMVGDPNATWFDALVAGLTSSACWFFEGSQACSGDGTTVTFDPDAWGLDISMLREAGIAPQPLD